VASIFTNRSADIEASVSKSSWATVILNKVVGLVLLGFGILVNNPLYLLAGLVLIALAVWYLRHAKDRANDRRQIFSVVAVEMDSLRLIRPISLRLRSTYVDEFSNQVVDMYLVKRVRVGDGNRDGGERGESSFDRKGD
jgi:hypothetical protein